MNRTEAGHSVVKKSECMRVALDYGVRAGAVAGALSAAGVGLAHKYYPAFRSWRTVSGKTAIVVMPILGTYSLACELVLHASARDPVGWGIALPAGSDPAPAVPAKAAEAAWRKDPGTYTSAKRLANWGYDHPVKFLGVLGVPAVGVILKEQMAKPNLKVSQRLMMTRVFGQSSVIGMLLITAGLIRFMDKNGGRFEIEGEDEEAGYDGRPDYGRL